MSAASFLGVSSEEKGYQSILCNGDQERLAWMQRMLGRVNEKNETPGASFYSHDTKHKIKILVT